MDHEQAGQSPADFKKARRQKANLKDPLKEDRLPPHDEPAELAVLGCILLSPVESIGLCIEKLSSSEAFYGPARRTIYETMLDMHADGVPIDVLTLRSELSDLCKLEEVGGLAFVAGLPDAAPVASNLPHYLEIVQAKFTLRRAIATCTEVVTRAYEHEGEVDELIEQLTSDILSISQSTQQVTTLHLADPLVQRTVDWMEHAHQNPGQMSGIPTGFVDFDTLTNGLQNGEMIVIAARPSVGKSSLCMNIADYVAVNLHLPVVVFSLEMSALSLMNRAVCSRARVSMNHAKRGQMNMGEFQRASTAVLQIRQSRLLIDDACGTSIMQLTAKARRYKQQHGIRLIVIDYLQMLSARAESRQQEITAISSGIKSMAKELNVPVIVASQLNRELEKDKKGRKPRMSDIRESGSVEQDADLIGLLYRPTTESGEAEQDGGQNENGAVRVNFIIAKQRNGDIGEIPFTFLKSFTRFESAAQSSQETA